MGLSRRMFTKEFKLAAVQRLERGSSIGEVALEVNPKRVYRLMREDNLLCVRQRKFVVTTDSSHTRKVYPEPGAEYDPDGHRSTVAGRYHLHPAARRVRVPGRDPGRLLAPRDRLGAGSHDGR